MRRSCEAADIKTTWNSSGIRHRLANLYDVALARLTWHGCRNDSYLPYFHGHVISPTIMGNERMISSNIHHDLSGRRNPSVIEVRDGVPEDCKSRRRLLAMLSFHPRRCVLKVTSCGRKVDATRNIEERPIHNSFELHAPFAAG